MNQVDDRVWTVFSQIVSVARCLKTPCNQNATQLEDFLTKLLEMIDKWQDVFVASATEHRDQAARRAWFIHWIVKFLLFRCSHYQESQKVSELCLKVQLRLLTALHFRHNYVLCRQLLLSYIRYLDALHEASNSLYDGKDCVHLTPFEHDSNDIEIDSSDATIELSDPGVSERIQNCILLVLATSAKLVTILANDLLPELWKILTKQIIHEDPVMKHLAIRTAAAIVANGGFPSTVVSLKRLLDVYFDYALGLIGGKLGNTHTDVTDVWLLMDQLVKCEKLVGYEQKYFIRQYVSFWHQLLSMDVKPQVLSDGFWMGLLFVIQKYPASLVGVEDFVLKLWSIFAHSGESGSSSNHHIRCVLAALVKNWLNTSCQSNPDLDITGKDELEAEVPKKSSLELGERCCIWNRVLKLIWKPDMTGEILRLARKIRYEAMQCYPGTLELFDKRLVGELIHLWTNQCEQADQIAWIRCLDDVANLLMVQAKDSFSLSSLHQVVALLTAPWIPGDRSQLQDLKISDTLAEALSRLGKKLDDDPVDLKVKCIQLVFSVRNDVAPKWRMQVLRRAMSSGQLEYATSVIRVLPLILHQFGTNGHCLTRQLMHAAINMHNDEVTLELAKLSGILLCAFSGHARLEKNDASATGLTVLLCSQCEAKSPRPVCDAHEIPSREHVDLLVKLIGHTDRRVSLAIIGMLKSMAVHVGFDKSTVSLWLSYLQTSDANLCHRLSGQMCYLVSCLDSQAVDGMSNALLDNLKEAVERARAEGSMALGNAICRFLASIASSTSDTACSLERSILELQLELLLHRSTHIAMYCNVQDNLRLRIYQHKGVSAAKLAEHMVTGGCKVAIGSVVSVYMHGQFRTFLTNLMHHLLPRLVVECSSKRLTGPESPVEFVSSLMEVPCHRLLVKHFHFIYSHLIIASVGSEQMAKCTNYLQAIVKVDIRELLKSKRHKVLMELMVHFHKHKKRVLSALVDLAMYDEEATAKAAQRVLGECKAVRSKKASILNVMDLIMPQFLGVLSYMDQRLGNTFLSADKKADTLLSLSEMIRFMGSKNVARVKHKIMSTLHTAHQIKDEEVQKNVLLVWESLILTIEMELVGPIISQIVAYLMHFFRRHASTVVKLFHFLIVTNQSQLQNFFDRLHFLPELEELTEINQIIRTGCGINDKTEFRQVLGFVAKSMDVENVEVRVLTLRKLLQLLTLNRSKLHSLILANDQVDSMIRTWVHLLIRSTKEKDTRISSLAGQCLGCIGAIDPGRLSTATDLNVDTSTLNRFSAEQSDFAVDLIHHLVRAYLSTGCSLEADACAYSIQEVLKAYSVRPNAGIWNLFTDFTKEVLQPLLASHYSQADKKIQIECPVFMSGNGDRYEKWLANWTSHLMDQVQDTRTASIFFACRPAVSVDIPCTEFLLPYLLVHVICQDNAECRDSILKEFQLVLQAVAARSVSSSEAEAASLVRHNSDKSTVDLIWMASQTLFLVLDHMSMWLGHRQQQAALLAEKPRSRIIKKQQQQQQQDDKECQLIANFIRDIPQVLLAEAAYGCKAYARALRHIEGHVAQFPDQLQKQLHKLQKIYGALQEPDYIVGVEAIRESQPTLEDQILNHQILGNFQDALACYEALWRQDQKQAASGSRVWAEGMLRCYLQMDQPYTASLLAKGMLSVTMSPEVKKYQLEAAWQLEQWDEIDPDKISASPDGLSCWHLGLASILSAFKHGHYDKLEHGVSQCRNSLLIPIAASAMDHGSYRRNYENVVRLQILDEIQCVFQIQARAPSTQALAELFDGWRSRLAFSQYSAVSLEQVLKVRRTLLTIALAKCQQPELRERFRAELSECWLMCVKVARKSGLLDKAYKLMLETPNLEHKESVLERAKLLWRREEQKLAIDTLLKHQSEWADGDDISIGAKVSLLLAQYVDESGSQGTDKVMQHYSRARTLQISEDAFYRAAHFFDKNIGKIYAESDLDQQSDILCHVISLYCRSLLLGCRHIHQSLPRLLSLWFDFGSRVVGLKDSNRPRHIIDSMAKNFRRINDTMLKFVDKCPAYIFLATIPQICSRICHSNPEVWAILRNILLRTFTTYPHHVFWQMVALSNSSYQTRVHRSKEIFDLIKAKAPSLTQLLDIGLQLVEKVVRLSNEKLPAGETTLTQVAPALMRLFTSSTRLMIPSSGNTRAVFPADVCPGSEHNPFPDDLIYIQGVKDEVVVMRSLVQPKKITFIGTDGRQYSFLCKPKDDLRRDCRLVDFNILLNKLLMRDPECRKRDLHIKTYNVIPLNETSGIIEWIENLRPLRIIIMKLYKEKQGSRFMHQEELKMYATTDDVERNRRNFQTLLQRHPPIFSEWFLRYFPDPQSWFMARLGYTRTTAVMSMVGYLLGLGDRHGENILLDGSNGDIVHVDLNCLFNKGQELKVPEVVPFRLTHNMVSAMGPTGYEGPFRVTCQVSLGLMKQQKDILMSALRPFVFDPLVEWVVPSGRHKRTDTGEIVNEKAVETLKSIEDRLDGYVQEFGKKSIDKSSTHFRKPLSVEGQVDHLLKEATSFDNLSQMYLGWGPYF